MFDEYELVEETDGAIVNFFILQIFLALAVSRNV